jgi:hypothetical protein
MQREHPAPRPEEVEVPHSQEKQQRTPRNPANPLHSEALSDLSETVVRNGVEVE